MTDILESSLFWTGNNVSDFIAMRKEFEQHTVQVNINFSSTDFVFWHFIKIDEKQNELLMQRISEKEILALNDYSNNEKEKEKKEIYKVDMTLFQQSLLYDITNGNIIGILEFEQKQIFIDKNCLSKLVAKAGLKGNFFYTNSRLSVFALFSSLLGTNKEILLNCRTQDGFIKAVGVFSCKAIFPSVILYVNELMKQVKCDLTYYEITQKQTKLFFELPIIEGFVPVIRLEFSDTGYGNKKHLCVKSEKDDNPKAGITISDFEDFHGLKLLVADFVASIKTINSVSDDDFAIDKISEKIKNPQLIHAIGIKRVNLLFPLFFKTTNGNALKTIAEFPTIVGDINKTSEDELMIAAGWLFNEILNSLNETPDATIN